MLFSRRPARPPAQDTTHAELRQLAERLAAIERAEALRAAEHAAALDKLERLYKRMAARVAREPDLTTHNGESVLDLRNRLGR